MKFALRSILTVSILSALIIWLPTDELWSAIRKTGFMLWGFALLGTVLFHIVAGWKWKILLIASGFEVKLLECLRAHAAGLFANIWLPSLIGGDVVRMGLVTKNKKQLASAFTGSITDRINDVVSLLILIAVGILWLPSVRENLGIRSLILITVLIFCALISVPVFLKYIHANWFPKRIADAVEALKTALDAVYSKKKSLVIAQSLSLVVQTSFVLFNAAIGDEIGIQVPMAAWFFAWPLAKLAALVPISLGGIGVREVAMAAFLAAFSVDPTLSVAQSLVWETIILVLGLIGGILSLSLGRVLQRKERKELGAAVNTPRS